MTILEQVYKNETVTLIPI